MPLFVLSRLFLNVLHARRLLVESKRRLVTVAQLAEHRVVVPKVAGSSPVGHPMRIQRGIIAHDKDAEGHLFVYVDTSDMPTNKCHGHL